MNRYAIALMYHRVLERPEQTYDVSCAAFDSQCALLARQQVISLEALLAGQAGVTLTFDDGFASCLSRVAPRMLERGWPAMAYITSGYLGRPGYLRAGDLRELARCGFMIGAHGHTHRALTSLGDSELGSELARSRCLLEDTLGGPVVHMALPGGKGNARVVRAAQATGFCSIATSWPGVVRGIPRPYALPRAALRWSTREAAFKQILSGSGPYFAGNQAREFAAATLPRMLGSRAYNFLGFVRRALRDRPF